MNRISRGLALGAVLGISGCANWSYTMTCGETKVEAKARGFAYTRTVGGITLSAEKCGTATVQEAQTDTEKAFEAGVSAGKAIIGAAIKP